MLQPAEHLVYSWLFCLKERKYAVQLPYYQCVCSPCQILNQMIFIELIMTIVL